MIGDLDCEETINWVAGEPETNTESDMKPLVQRRLGEQVREEGRTKHCLVQRKERSLSEIASLCCIQQSTDTRNVNSVFKTILDRLVQPI